MKKKSYRLSAIHYHLWTQKEPCISRNLGTHHNMISLTSKLSGTSASRSSVPSPSDVALSFSLLLRLLSHICAKAFRLATDAVLDADLPDAAFRKAL